MRRRLRAALIIARREAFETLLSPGLYITLTLGLLLGFALVRSFTLSVDSSGFNPRINVLCDFLDKALSGAFGTAFVAKVFEQGPLALALVGSFLPVFLFLAISSVFRFGVERSTGAVELLAYGPADGTSCFLASFLRDVGFAAASLAVIALLLALMATVGNLSVGPLFLRTLGVVFCLSVVVFAYGVLFSVLSSNAASALSLFLAALIVFLLLLAGSLALMDVPARVLSWASLLLQWFSPFYYASLCLRAAERGAAAGALGAAALLLVLAFGVLAASHAVLRRRGVRA
jgi:hypothetical protein